MKSVNAGKARATIAMENGYLRVRGYLGDRLVVKAPANSIDDADNFALDFVSKNKKKKVNEHDNAGEPAVLC